MSCFHVFFLYIYIKKQAVHLHPWQFSCCDIPHWKEFMPLDKFSSKSTFTARTRHKWLEKTIDCLDLGPLLPLKSQSFRKITGDGYSCHFLLQPPVTKLEGGTVVPFEFFPPRYLWIIQSPKEKGIYIYIYLLTSAC